MVLGWSQGGGGVAESLSVLARRGGERGSERARECDRDRQRELQGMCPQGNLRKQGQRLDEHIIPLCRIRSFHTAHHQNVMFVYMCEH